MDANRQVLLRDLREKIRAVEARVFSDAALSTAAANPTPSALRSTGWADIDAAMGGGLAAGGLHEWLGVEFSESATRSPDGHRFSSCGRWSVPLCILVHLARRAAAQDEASRWTLWIGRTCHPYPPLLACKDEHGRALLERSMFVAPRDAAERLWAIDLALHSPAVGCVVADGSRFDRAATQRLQMLARTRLKWALVARPSQERSELSAAQTRWFVRTEPPRPKDAPHGAPCRWIVELLRCKGVQPATGDRTWRLEWNRETGAVDLSAAVCDLAGAPFATAGTARPHTRTA